MQQSVSRKNGNRNSAASTRENVLVQKVAKVFRFSNESNRFSNKNTMPRLFIWIASFMWNLM